MEKNHKILIIDPMPYSLNSTGRALDAYFHFSNKNDLAQIFTANVLPQKDYCSFFYRINDIDILKRTNRHCGKVIDEFSDTKGNEHNTPSLLRHNYFFHFLRYLLWKNNHWHSKKLDNLIDDFKPNIILVVPNFDFFCLDIAEYYSKKFNIPVIFSILDDYYFSRPYNTIFLRRLYLKKYRKRFKSFITNDDVFPLYLSKKMQNLYNYNFKVSGRCIPLASSLELKSASKFSKDIKNFVYAGSLGVGRLKTLLLFAEVLKNKIPDATINIYSFLSKKQKTSLLSLENVFLHEPVSYLKLQEILAKSDCLLALETLYDAKYINLVKYSMSTKTGDLMSYGKPILAIGNKDCGAISYYLENNSAFIATSLAEIENSLIDIRNTDLQKDKVKNSISAFENDFDINKSCSNFYEFVDYALNLKK